MLPPLLAGEGWGGVALRWKIQSLAPHPTSPSKEGEERAQPLSIDSSRQL